jgi:hypothetical protein
MITIFAILDQVSNTEGISSQLLIQTLLGMLTIFVAVILGIVTMINLRFTSIESQLKELAVVINLISGKITPNDYTFKTDFKAIKDHFNISTPDTLPDEDGENLENTRNLEN